MRPPVRVVRKQTAFSPVARAVARKLLNEALVDQKIAMYQLDNGDPCVELMKGLGTTLAVVGVAAEMQGIDGPDLNILRGGMSACDQMAASNYFDRMNITSIDMALYAAERINLKLAPISINRAWRLFSNAAVAGSA